MGQCPPSAVDEEGAQIAASAQRLVRFLRDRVSSRAAGRRGVKSHAIVTRPHGSGEGTVICRSR